MGANPNGRQFAIAAANTLQLDKLNAAGIGNSVTTVTSTSAYVIVAVTYDARVVTFYVNGVFAGAATSAQTFGDGTVNQLGAYGSGNTLDADVAAFFGSSNVLSAQDLERLTKFWSSKYNVVLG